MAIEILLQFALHTCVNKFSHLCCWSKTIRAQKKLIENFELLFQILSLTHSDCAQQAQITQNKSWSVFAYIRSRGVPQNFGKLLNCVFLALIFIPARSHAAQNRSNACWSSCWEDASSTKSSGKTERLILQLTNMTPFSTQLWLSIQFM